VVPDVDMRIEWNVCALTSCWLIALCLQVGATLDVYESVQKQLLPTPTKSHYTFNLRDMSKVFQVRCCCCCCCC
jgi:hypothetical protein